MTKELEAFRDSDGQYVAAKSTTVIISEFDLRVLLGILNSKLISVYYNVTFGGDKLVGR